MNKPVNEKWDESGKKRSSWYICLYNVAIGEMNIKDLEPFGIDARDRKYIEDTRAFAAECRKNGVVMQFTHPFEG